MDALNSSPLRRAADLFTRRHEQAAFCLLLAWCLLPCAAGIVFCIMAALGKFPTLEQIAAAGMALGGTNYGAALKAYQNMFHILGALTLLFALLTVAACRRRVFRSQSLRQSPWFYLFALLLGWALLSAFASGYFYHAFLGGAYFRDGLASYFIYAAIFVCASVIRDETRRRRLLRCFAAVISALALLMLVQVKTGSAYLNYVFPSARATVFNQFNHFGYMLCMAAVGLMGLLLHDTRAPKWLRTLYPALLLLLAYALVINNTFGAILATVLSVPVVLVFYVRAGRKLNGKVVALTLALAILALICFFALSARGGGLADNFAQLGRDLVKIATRAEDAGDAGTGRLQLWHDTLRRIRERPLFGYGPEGFVGPYALTDGKRTHNEYLLAAGSLGIPALALYLAGIITLAVHQWRRLRRLEPMVLAAAGMSVAYLLSAFVGNPVFNTAPYFWLFLGLTAGVCPGETPLLSPVDDGRDEKGSVLLTLLGVLLCVSLCVCAGLSRRAERRLELTDLETMRAAETAARKAIDPAMLGGETAYSWYDREKDTLRSASLRPPAPYGAGSFRDAESAAYFQKNGYFYLYDESADYSGQVLVVVTMADEDGSLKVGMRWLEAEG